MDRDEVLDAKIALASLIKASLLNNSIFTAAFSTIASIKRSALHCSMSLTKFMRQKVSEASIVESFCLLIKKSRLAFMAVAALSSVVAFTSNSVVTKPPCAATSAIPLPIVPAPITQICCIIYQK